MDNGKLRDEIAVKAMAALLSNSHFCKHHLRKLHEKKVLKKNDEFFKLMAAFACQAADALISRMKLK